MDTKTLVDGLYFPECPRWHQSRLWFSDLYDHAVKSTSIAGDLRTEATLDDKPAGLGWLPDGRLLIVSMQARTLLRREQSGDLVKHADISRLIDFSANDMAVDAEGRAWVGGFGFDLETEFAARPYEEIIANPPPANIARVDRDGSVHLAASGMLFPNGSVVTPDGKTLIVAETLGARLTAFTITPDGRLTDRRVWAPVPGRNPDGIALAPDGNIWMANGLGPECVLVAPGGEILRNVETSQLCLACAIGGDSGDTLFLATSSDWRSEVVSQSRTGKIEYISLA